MRQCELYQGDAVFYFTLLQGDHAQHMECVEVLGVELQHGLIRLPGGRQLSLTMQAHGLLQLRDERR